jgi:hypothetical protein
MISGLFSREDSMTQRERLRSLSTRECCMCDHQLTVGDLEEFYGRADEQVHGEVYCRSCLEAHLWLCRECSGRYTADPGKICSECNAGMYGMVG